MKWTSCNAGVLPVIAWSLTFDEISSREAHGDNAWRDVGEVKVKAILLESSLVL